MTVKKKPAPPVRYTPEVATEIYQRIEQGESLRSISRDPAMPHLKTICKWFHKYPDFYTDYVKAKEIRAELVFDELLELADSPDVRTMEEVNWMRMRLDIRKWCLSKMHQTRFGNKIEATHKGIEGLAERLASARERVCHEKAYRA